MKKRGYLAAAFILLAAVFGLSGCGDRENGGLDPKSPAVVTVWHAYNAVAKAQFDELVMEFNETVGMEQGIVVDAVGYGSSEELEDVLYASANQVIGSEPLPDIFASYPDNAYRLDKIAPLVNMDDYFTEDELKDYRPEFLEEGIWDDASCKMIPVSKSTELLYLNKTDWEKFSRETGASDDLLYTWEGLIEAAGMYYEWSGGNPFLGMNSYNDYAILTAAQMGTQVYREVDGNMEFCYPEEIARKAWDAYYVPHILGWFESRVYNQDGIKSGRLMAYIGSSAGAGFFPREVIEDEDKSYPIECASFPYPTFRGETSYMTQRGANMAVFESDHVHEYASAQFLKWFTQPEQNIRFAVSTGYLPVKTAALESVDGLLKQTGDAENAEMVEHSIETELKAMREQEFYIKKPFGGSYDMNQIFTSSLENKTALDLHELNRRVEEGGSREKVEAGLLGEENFKAWYGSLMREMAGRTDG
ncbi:extracellular solute-binding protein [Clostridiales bacterium TF09-2AC]|nr:extracellular solute-binding protein [Clostridiales bacterium TF09-2AC]